MRNYLISPSLLSANFAKLGEEAQNILNSGGDMLHLDVMDNHYVPNLTVGPLVCDSLRKYGITGTIDVHLMVKPVDRLIIDFAKAGASMITFHPESSDHVDRSIDLIKNHGCKAGLALNPATTLHCLEFVLDKLDLILVMGVNPGFAGQTFIPNTLEKIKQVRALIDTVEDHKILLAVDGGVKIDNIYDIASAGAEMFIAGSAIFKHSDYKHPIDAMRNELKRVR